VEQAMNWTSLIGVFLVSTFMSMKLGWEYFKMSTQGSESNWDWSEYGRVLVLLIMITFFKPLATSITGSLKGLNEITQSGSKNNQKLRDVANDYNVKRINVEHDEKVKKLNARTNSENDPIKRMQIEMFATKESAGKLARVEGMADLATEGKESQIEEGLQNVNGENGGDSIFWLSITSLLNLITHFLAGIVKWTIGTFVKVVFQVGIVFGPIVLAFGIIFKDKPIQYLNQMLTLGLVFTTLNILDMLMASFMISSFASPSVGQAVAFDLAMIGCYLSAFKLTSMFVGATGLNSIMGRGMGVAAGGAAAVMGGVAMAAGGSGSRFSGAARAASAGIQQASRQRLD
jgi:hypothetical protein